MIKTIALIGALIVLGAVSLVVIMLIIGATMCLFEYLDTKLKRLRRKHRKYPKANKKPFINPERLYHMEQMWENITAIFFFLLFCFFTGALVYAAVLEPLLQ